MKAAVVIHHFDPHRGGAEAWTFQFVEQAIAAGHDMHVVAQSFGRATEHLDIARHHLPLARSKVEFARSAEVLLRSLRVDVIHDMGCGWYFDILQPHDGSRMAQFAQKLHALPVWARPMKRAAARWLPRYRDFDELGRRQFADHNRLVIALSRMVARDLQRYEGWPRERIRLIHNGVDLARFSPEHRAEHRGAVRARLGVRSDEVLVLFVGHDFQRKGLPVLLRSIGRLVRSGRPVRLAVLGGKRTKTYARLADRAGAGPAVTFVGSVGDSVPYYAAADVYAMPTLYDPCSLGVLEALASGLPIITSGNNGAGEIVTEGAEGFIVADPADERTLTERLEALLNADVRNRMGGAARKLMEDHSLEANCRRVLELYDEVAWQRRKAA